MEVCVDLSKKNKKVPPTYIASDKKKPAIIENPRSFYGKTPVWSFSRCDFEHDKWSVFVNQEKLPSLLLRLKTFEGQTWNEILSDTSGRKCNTKNHSIPRTKLTKEAQKRIEEINLDDFDEIYSLSITGQHRLWGVIIDGTFCIVWYDLDHEIYPVSKRHT